MKRVSKKWTLFFVYFLTMQGLWAQTCADINNDFTLTPIAINGCSGDAEYILKVGWIMDAAQAANAEILVDWDDGQAPQVFGSLSVIESVGSIDYYGITGQTHTYDYANGYPSGNNINAGTENCTFVPRIYLRINGVDCPDLFTLGTQVTVWDTEDNFNLNAVDEEDPAAGSTGLFTTPAAGDYNICAGNTNAHRLQDISIWNCTTNPEETLSPNEEGRWVQYIYGETNSFSGGTVTVGGANVPAGQVYYGPVQWVADPTAATPASAAVVFPANAGVGECFSIRFRSWNVCNAYGADGSTAAGFLGAASDNLNHGGANDPVDLWTRTICTIEAPPAPAVTQPTVCFEGDQTITATPSDPNAIISWYDENMNFILDGSNTYNPNINWAGISTPITVAFFATQKYDAGAGVVCESVPSPVTLTLYPEIDNSLSPLATADFCFNTNLGTISGNVASGGAGNGYQYQWEYRFSGDGSSWGAWQNAQGSASGQNYDTEEGNYKTNEGYYEFRRVVASLVSNCNAGNGSGNDACVATLCESNSNEIALRVYPDLSNNTIDFNENGNATIRVCNGRTPVQVDGSSPLGGKLIDDPDYQYAWEFSYLSDFSVLENPATANSSLSGVEITEALHQDLYVRRIVWSDCDEHLIAGHSAAISNSIRVIVKEELLPPEIFFDLAGDNNEHTTANICYEEDFNIVIKNGSAQIDGLNVQYRVRGNSGGNYSTKRGWQNGQDGQITINVSELTGSGGFNYNNPNQNFRVEMRYSTRDDYGNRCNVNSNVISLNINDQITVAAGSDDQLCEGDQLLLDAPNATGGSGAFSYTWTGPSSLSQNAQTVTINEGDATYPALNTDHTYTLTVEDTGFTHSVAGETCPLTDTKQVIIYENPSAALDVSDITICPGAALELANTISAGGASGSLTYNWRSDREVDGAVTDFLFDDAIGSNDNAHDEQTPFFIPDGSLAGTFDFWVEVTETNAGHGCLVYSDTVQVSIDSNAPTGGILTNIDHSTTDIPPGLLQADGTAFAPSDCSTDVFLYAGATVNWKNTLAGDLNFPAANFDQVEVLLFDSLGNIVMARHVLSGNNTTNNSSTSNDYQFIHSGEYRLEMIFTNTSGGSGCNVATRPQTIRVQNLPFIQEIDIPDICQGTTVMINETTDWAGNNFTPTYYQWEVKDLSDNSTLLLSGDNGGVDAFTTYNFPDFGEFELRAIVTALSQNGLSCDYSKVIDTVNVHEAPLVNVTDANPFQACGAFEVDLAAMASVIGLTYSGQTEVEWFVESGAGNFKFDDTGLEASVNSSKEFNNFYLPAAGDENSSVTLRFVVRNPANVAACDSAYIDIPLFIHASPRVNALIDTKYCYGAEVTLLAERTDVGIAPANVNDFAWDTLGASPDFRGTITSGVFYPNTATNSAVTSDLILYPTNVVAACNVEVMQNFSDTIQIEHNARIDISNLPDQISLCSDEVDTLIAIVSGGSGNYDYEWYVGVNPQGNNAPQFNFSQSVPFADDSTIFPILLEIRDDFITIPGNECTQTYSLNASVFALPEVTAGADKTFCFGDTTSLNAVVNLPPSRSLAMTYWYDGFVLAAKDSINGTIDFTDPDYNNIYPQSPTYPGYNEVTYRVQIEDEHGCRSVFGTGIPSIEQSLTAYASPQQPIINGEDELCLTGGGLNPSGFYTFNRNAYSIANTTYQFTIDPADTTTSTSVVGAPFNAYLVEFKDDGVWDVQLEVTHHYTGLSCISPPDTMQVIVNPEPTDHIISREPGTICQGDTLLFTIAPVSPGGSFEYEWQVNRSYFDTLSGPAVHQKYLVFNGDFAGAVDVEVEVFNLITDAFGNMVRGCGVTDTLSIFINEAPDYTFTADAYNICSGAAVVLSLENNDIDPLTFDYSFDGGGLITGGTTAVQTVPVASPPPAPANIYDFTDTLLHAETSAINAHYRLAVTNNNSGCQALDSITMLVNPSISNPVVSVAPDSICANSTAEITSSITNGYAYNWMISTNGGSTFDSLENRGDLVPYLRDRGSSLSVIDSDYEVLKNTRIYQEVLGCGGIEQSNTIDLLIIPRPEIVQSPLDTGICERTTAAFVVEIDPYDSLEPALRPEIYWEVRQLGTWERITEADSLFFEGYETNRLVVKDTFALPENDRSRFRANIRGICDANFIPSQPAMLTIYPKPGLRVPLDSISVCNTAQEVASFYADALNTFEPTYAWKVSFDSGATYQLVDTTNVFFADFRGQGTDLLQVENVNGKGGLRFSVEIGSSSLACGSTVEPAADEVGKLTVLALPDAYDHSISFCSDDELGNSAFLRLTHYDSLVNGGTSNFVSWYMDASFSLEVSNKFSHYTEDADTLYARVVNANGCASGAVVVFNLTSRPQMASAMPTAYYVCDSTALVVQPDVSPSAIVDQYHWQLVPNGNIEGLAMDGFGNTVTQGTDSLTWLLKNRTTTDQSLEISFTAENNGCFSEPLVVNATVYPQPSVVVENNRPEICDQGETAISVRTGVNPANFTYFTYAVDGVTQRDSLNNPIQLTNYGAIMDELENTSQIPVDFEFSLTPWRLGCPNPGPSDSVLVAVNPTPIALMGALPDTLCSGELVNIPITSNTSLIDGFDLVYTYNSVSDGGFGTLSGPGVQNGFVVDTAYTISGQIDNVTDEPRKLIYSVTPTIQGCNNNKVLTISDSLIIKPVPSMTIVNEAERICNFGSTEISLNTTNVTNSNLPMASIGFVGTATASDPSLSGFASSYNLPAIGGQAVIEDVLVNTSNQLQTVTYRIRPYFDGCLGAEVVTTVEVYPTLDITVNNLEPRICSDGSAALLLNTLVNVPNHQINYRATASDPSVFGFSNFNRVANIGDTIRETITNYSNTPQLVTYEFQVVTDDGACTGPLLNRSVAVDADLTFAVEAVQDQICNGDTAIIELSTPVRTSGGQILQYHFSPVVNSHITGALPMAFQTADSSGLASLASVLVNDTTTIQEQQYQLWLTLTDGANNIICQSAEQVVSIFVRPTLFVDPVADVVVCPDELVVIPPFSGAATYTWTNDNTAINLAANGSRNIPVFTSANVLSVNEVANITVQGLSQGCNTQPLNFSITVKPTPNAPLVNGDRVYCQDDTLRQLAATGSNINWYNSSLLSANSLIGAGNSFTPDTTDVDSRYSGAYAIYGTQTINGCESPATTVNYTINPKALVAYNLIPLSDCSPTSVKLVNVTQGQDTLQDLWEYQILNDPSSRQVFSWDANEEAVFQNTAATAVTYELMYTATTALGCTEMHRQQIVVNPQIDFSFRVIRPLTYPSSSCSGTAYTFERQNLGNTDAIPDLRYIWNFGDGTVLETDSLQVTHLFENASFQNPRTFNVSLTVESSFCQESRTLPVEIYPQVLSNLELLNNVGCGPLAVTFINNSRGHDLSLGQYERRILGTTTWQSFSPLNNEFTFDNTTFDQIVWEVRYVARNQFSCPAISAISLVTVNPRPVASFSHPALICEGAPAIFDATASTGDIDSYQWDFGDFSLPKYGDSLTYNYPFAGYYYVLLTTTNTVGCTDTISANLQVQISPQVTLESQGPVNFCDGGAVEITSTVNDSVTYQWLKDQAVISGATNPNYSATETGAYALVVTQTAGVGCSRLSDTLRVQVYDLPHVQLVRNKPDKILCPGEEVVFTASADLNIQHFIFHVNEQAYSANLERNEFRFNRIQEYDTVFVQAITYEGCSGQSPDLIQDTDILNPDFTVIGSAEGCSAFTASFELDTLVNGLQYTWDFGDGVIEQHNTAQVSHTYINSDPFLQNRHIVTLTVFNPATDCSASAEGEIRVNPSPVADFDLTADRGCAPLRVGVINNSALVNKINGSSYSWVVSDSLDQRVIFTSAIDNPYFELPNVSTSKIIYEVSLTVEDAYGCESTATRYVTVYPEVRPDYIVDALDNTQLWPDREFSIINTTNEGEKPSDWRYVWKVNGEEVFLGADIHSLFFEQPGLFNLTLVVESGPCIAEVTQLLTLQGTNPIVDFIPNPKVGCVPLEVHFENLSRNTDEFTLFTWDFGDGGQSNESSPTYTYENPGTYYVSLSANNLVSDGLFFQKDTIIVHPTPTVNFRVTPEKVFLPEAEVEINNFTTGAFNQYTLDWGDGTIVENASPDADHIYSQPDDYFVTMTVENEFGCAASSTIEQPVLVRDGGKIQSPNAFQPRGDGPSGSVISENDSRSGYYPIFAPYTPNVVPEGYQLEIYTRWGQMVYQTRVLGEGWNGYYFNNGNPLPAGVYIYKLDARTVDGNRVSQVGDVTLLK
ncbi:PKD domain-containing protein [Persicobacter diffluens]|uniref:PKD domain-containing protein n=1 Tax=Persicobacter diffluens TaxID=981 RepID=A0AAN4VYM2_9BACT|nr:hypothetical protein PEDI_19050 [Persicobacter diffluens]